MINKDEGSNWQDSDEYVDYRDGKLMASKKRTEQGGTAELAHVVVFVRNK
jgi:hypothetical protein